MWRGPGAAFALAALLSVGCTMPVVPWAADRVAPSPAASPTSAAPPTVGEQMLRWIPGPVQTLQPILTSDATSKSVWSLVYLPFLETDGDTGELRPGLAESYAVSTDGRMVTFTLRPGLVWSDGEPVTGEDYRYAIEGLARARKGADLAAAISGYIDYANGRTDHIAGIVVRDGGRVVDVSLLRAFCAAPRTLDFPLLPRHRFLADWNNRTTDVSKSIANNALNDAPPASVGPFVFHQRTDTDIRMVRNERYYKGAPRLAGITFTSMDGPALRAAVRSGRMSWIAILPSEVDGWKQVSADQMEVRLVRRPSTYHFIGWNPRSARAPWLADKRVRQALWYALNLDDIVGSTLGGYGHRVYTHTPETSWAYDGSALNHYEFDPKRARQLLEQAGATMGPDGLYRWSDGRSMRMRIETNDDPTRRSVLSNVVVRYRAIGIAVDPVVEPFETLSQRARSTNNDVDGFINGWQLPADPDSFEFWHSTRVNGNNLVAFSNSDVDRALEAGRSGPDCSTAARRRAYATVDRILNNEAPYAFLYSSDLIVLVSKRLDGVAIKPYNEYADVERWSFANK